MFRCDSVLDSQMAKKYVLQSNVQTVNGAKC